MEEVEVNRQRWKIDETTKRRAIELYKDPEQKLSLRRVGKQLGICDASVRNILIRNNESRRSTSEANMKYPKKDFSGDPKEQARIVGFLDDCDARYHRRQIHVHTSTTHPAQMKLFDGLFGGRAHQQDTGLQ